MVLNIIATELYETPSIVTLNDSVGVTTLSSPLRVRKPGTSVALMSSGLC